MTRRSFAATDHPRIRGEHSVPEAPPRALPGSSPHTRGAPPTLCRWWRNRRIIPAYAGSTLRRHGHLPTRPDHPRIRGEHPPVESTTHGFRGSSPHTRGALRFSIPRHGDPGIIPAYAGSTPHRLAHGRRRPDHPRIRGEHAAAIEFSLDTNGSSPHTRGAQLAAHRRHD